VTAEKSNVNQDLGKQGVGLFFSKEKKLALVEEEASNGNRLTLVTGEGPTEVGRIGSKGGTSLKRGGWGGSYGV